MNERISVGIVGARGHVGAELIRLIAARDAWLNQLVCRPTEAQRNASNACPSSNSFASVLRPVRCTLAAYQV